jgi:DNA-binding PadR family transcriptional regulator
MYHPQWTVKREVRVNPTAASLLGLLDSCGESVTGGDLVRIAQARIGAFWNLTRSQVHRELAGLAAQGHVKVAARGPRDSRLYAVTESGRRAYRSWLADHLPDETIRIPLLLAVSFGRSLPNGRLRQILDEAEAQHRARLEGYRALEAQLEAQGVNAFARATLSFGVHYEEAVLLWFAALPVEVRKR